MTNKASSPLLRDDVELSPKGWPVPRKMRSTDAWRPPDTWECPSTEPQPNAPETPTRRVSRRKRLSSVPSDLAHLRRNIRRMDAASHRIVLERLQEEWLEVTDASMYRELELEKQLWMLSALNNLSKKSDLSVQVAALSVVKGAGTRVLSLYENHGRHLPSCLHSSLTSHSICLISRSNLTSPRSAPSVHIPTLAKSIPKRPSSVDSRVDSISPLRKLNI